MDRALLLSGRQTLGLLPPIEQPLSALAEAVVGPMQGAGAVGLLLPRDGDTETMASPGWPHLPTTVSLGTHQTTRPTLGASAPAPFPRPACQQRFTGAGCGPWARGEAQRQQRAPACRAALALRPAATWPAPERCGLGVPAGGPSRVLVCSASRALPLVESPVQGRGGLRTLLDRGKAARPEASWPPALQTA